MSCGVEVVYIAKVFEDTKQRGISVHYMYLLKHTVIDLSKHLDITTKVTGTQVTNDMFEVDSSQ